MEAHVQWVAKVPVAKGAVAVAATLVEAVVALIVAVPVKAHADTDVQEVALMD